MKIKIAETSDEIANCFPVMKQLRPAFTGSSSKGKCHIFTKSQKENYVTCHSPQ